MPQIASYEDVKAGRKQREIPGGYAWRTNFLQPTEDAPASPMAFLAEGTPQRVIKPHFHDVDQFQIIVSGGGVLGKHALAIHAVHFSRAHTPYGPIVAGSEGLGFLTLRAHFDPGAQYLTEAREKLTSVPNRNPWQATELPDFSGDADANLHTFATIKDERGLAAHSVKLKPNAKLAAPDPSNSNGQYIIVTRGSLCYQGSERKAITITFVKPDEEPMELVAGAEGMEALILHYPRLEIAKPVVPVVAKQTRFRVWQCQLCAFVYDEAMGMPEDGIAAGTRWEDVPDTWMCPDCATSKADFEMAVVA